MKLSIITVNYNNKIGLENTIKSVISQENFNDFEYIIIDGGSTDGSVDVIKEYADSINYWVSEPDKGIYNAMNKGVSKAIGDYCIFMNSGDCFFEKNVLHRIFSQNTINTDFIAGDYTCNNKTLKSPRIITGLNMFKTFNENICHQAVFIRRQILLDDPYKEEYKIVADWINMYNALVLNDATYEKVDIIISRIEPDGLSSINWKILSEEKDSYLKQVLPKRIYDDYQDIKNIKLLNNKNNELIKLLSNYNFNNLDINLAIFVLKVLASIRNLKKIIIK